MLDIMHALSPIDVAFAWAAAATFIAFVLWLDLSFVNAKLKSATEWRDQLLEHRRKLIAQYRLMIVDARRAVHNDPE